MSYPPTAAKAPELPYNSLLGCQQPLIEALPKCLPLDERQALSAGVIYGMLMTIMMMSTGFQGLARPDEMQKVGDGCVRQRVFDVQQPAVKAMVGGNAAQLASRLLACRC